MPGNPIVSISADNPTVIGCTGHNLINLGTVKINSSNSTPNADGTYIATVLNNNFFTIPLNVTVVGTSGFAQRIYYLDYESGNDNNNGATYTGRWKTFANGQTSARSLPGDELRIMASLDATSLGQSGLWTFGQKRIVLQSGVTSGIDGGEAGVWLSTGNTICTTDTTQFKEGTGSAKITISGTFSSGLAGYKTIPATNYSSFNQISFWIRNDLIPLPSGNSGIHTSLRLCSDTSGMATVNKFFIPPIPSIGQWTPITLDNKAPLGSSIQSVALWVDVPLPGDVDIRLDNIIACKDPSAPDSLTLTSLIGKNYGDETFWGIQSISGVNVALDAHNNNLGNAGRGYAGDTETVMTWKRETIKQNMAPTANSSASGFGAPTRAGTINNLMYYEGGWDRTGMLAQNGQSWFDGQNGFGNIFDLASFGFTSVNNFGFIRGGFGIRFGSALSQSYIIAGTIWGANNCSTAGVGITCSHFYANDIKAINSNGASLSAVFYIASGSIKSISSNVATQSFSSAQLTNFKDIKFLNNAANAFNIGSQAGVFTNILTSGNAAGGGFTSNTAQVGKITFQDSIFAETTPLVFINAFNDSRIFSINHNKITGDNRVYTDGGLIQTEFSNLYASGINSWKMSPTSTNRSPNYPLTMPLGAVATKPGRAITGSLWVYRNSPDLSGFLMIPPNQPTCQAASGFITGAISGWNQISVSTIPTQSGVVDFEIWCWGGTTNSLYFSNFTVSQ